MRLSKIKKFAYFSVGAVALSLLFLLILPKLVETAPIKSKLESQIQKATALDAKIMGPIKISFIPKTSIRCMDLLIADKDDNLNISVKEAYIDVGLVALIRKTIIIKQIYLLSPLIKIDWQKLNKNKTSTVVQDTKTVPQEKPITYDVQIKNLKIEDGVLLIVYESKKYSFENMNLTTHLFSFSHNSKIIGSFNYKGIKSNFDLNFSPLYSFIEGQELLVSIKFGSKDILESSLSGTFQKEEAGYKYLIKGNMHTKDILALGKILDLDTSKLKSNISSIHLTVEGQKDKINFGMSWDVGSQKILLDGYYLPSRSYGRLELRSGLLNLDRLFNLHTGKTSKDLNQKQEEAASQVTLGKVRHNKGITLDFDVSVDKITYNAKNLENIKVNGKYSDDNIEINQASFNLWNGTNIVKGKYNIINQAFQGNLQINNLSIYETLKETAEHTDITGTINANANISLFQISSPEFLTKTVAQGNLILKQGTIRNNKKLIDLANIIGFLSGALEKKEFLNYQINSMQYKIKEGKVLIEQGDLTSDLGDASFSGEINILLKQLELIAKPRNLKILTKSPFVSLKIYGPFNDIKVRPEFKAFPKDGLKELVDPFKQKLFKFKEDLR